MHNNLRMAKGNLHAWKSRMAHVKRYTKINQNKGNMDTKNWKRMKQETFFQSIPFSSGFMLNFSVHKGLDQYRRQLRKKTNPFMSTLQVSFHPPSVLSDSGSTKSKSGRDKAINGFTLWAVETTQFMCLKGECTYFTAIIYNIYGILCDLIVIGNLHDFKRMIRIPTFNIQHEAMWSSYHRYFDVETLLRTSPRNTWVDFALCAVF